MTFDNVFTEPDELLQITCRAGVASYHSTVREDYRSIYQDKSRTLYELEMKSDLGDAQAKVAEAIWMSIKVGFEKVVLWAELDAILGRPLLLVERREGQ